MALGMKSMGESEALPTEVVGLIPPPRKAIPNLEHLVCGRRSANASA